MDQISCKSYSQWKKTPEEKHSQALKTVRMLNQGFQSHQTCEMSKASWNHRGTENLPRPAKSTKQPARPWSLRAPELTGLVCSVNMRTDNWYTLRSQAMAKSALLLGGQPWSPVSRLRIPAPQLSSREVITINIYIVLRECTFHVQLSCEESCTICRCK